ncbi:MAG: pyridoxamine kinase [Coriobacteriia bacterium]|jgi:pyridoxine kinase|nr:pyridoxamine kinase [Coriobacteriia bacterium]MDR2714972.1 pyridoxamine kinase [Coriobacteriales bacterium]
MNQLKRVAAVHDISGVGKCSLTVALPIISAAGVECSVLPTAVLSTHTGGFEGFTFCDLTDEMMPIAEHWKKEGITFDAFYSGYLGSLAQIDLVQNIFEMFRTSKTVVMVDPVMADHGELYSLFTLDHVKGMAKLCGCADIIIPNRTEAAFMLEQEYKDGPMTEDEVEDLLYALGRLGAKQVVLTGVHFGTDDLGAACYDKKTGQIDYIMSKRIEGMYHGTGDVFGSFLLGALMREKSLAEATRIAVDYTCASIRLTAKDGTGPRMGVRFESVMPNYGKLFD